VLSSIDFPLDFPFLYFIDLSLSDKELVNPLSTNNYDQDSLAFSKCQGIKSMYNLKLQKPPEYAAVYFTVL
jgi:hypothetical protein